MMPTLPNGSFFHLYFLHTLQMTSPLFSTSAPAGWNQLPTAVKQKFYNIASKGEWSAHEAYDHLVPDTLKDNPDEVTAWMDGSPELHIPDRDVSRIEAGGDYSADNTIMEDMSVNRARGANDMTSTEFEATEAANAADTQTIEEAFESATEATADVFVETLPEASTFLGDVVQTASEAVLPIIFAYKGAKYVSRQFDDDTDKLGWGAVAAGAGAYAGTTTIGVAAGALWGGYCLLKLAYKTVNRFA